MTTVTLAVIAVSSIACLWDLRTRRIPNALTLPAALAAFAYYGLTGGGHGLLLSGAGWMVGFALFFVPFALGGLGAGDVKLLAALGAWLGPEGALHLALYTGAAGGVLALAAALRLGYLRAALANIWLLLTHWRITGVGPVAEVSLHGSSGPRLAYAVPVCAGALVTLWLH